LIQATKVVVGMHNPKVSGSNPLPATKFAALDSFESEAAKLLKGAKTWWIPN
jgi:hypothetical protein